MPSRFFDNTTTLLQGQLARAEAVEAKFELVDTALLGVANELNRAIRFTAGTPDEDDFQLAHTAAQRANQIIGFNGAGAPELRSGTFTWRGDWATAQTYLVNQVVRAPQANFFSHYVCVVQHVSGVFATDLAAGRWQLIHDMTEVFRFVRRFQIITAAQSPYAAVAGDDLFVDVSAGAVQITLPAAPTIADQPICVCHFAGNVVANNITIARNGQAIMGLAENMTVNTPNASFELSFARATEGWRLVKGT